uniref:Flavin-containing monooxygenase n=1 Tax=Helicotheca tamesis TaxID=374047 RepID=A0A7S2MNJ3_9STRA|mmetsp:Transcript_18857/g.25938  ORF Transcript_18857/g.25938 Transcript_18857/m.25938 type:complete len:403 (+) Transcript_18857:1-1209(+)
MGPTSTQGINKQIELNCWSKDFFSSDTALVPGKSASAVTAASKGRLDIVISPEARFGSNQVSFDRPHVFGTKTNHRRMNKNQKVADGKCQLDYEFDTIIACTGFKLDFDWIRIKSNNSSESSKMEVNTNPRTWFKHCFPPNFGESLAFVGFARPHSGGIPQCSEIVSRYIAQLYIGSLELPKDYAQLALSDGDAESACFHLTPHYNMLVDYTAYMMSVAKLLGCTPQIPLMDPVLMVKYWTFPLWPCFFRTKGVGADQTAARVILDKFGPWDALAPIPMLFAQLAMAFIMPFVNFVFFCTHATASSVAVKEEHGGSSEGQKRRALPWLYKWRLSKAHFLYYNSLTLEDFQWVLLQWIASSLIICYLLAKGMTTVFSVVASGILFPFNGHHHKATAAGKKKPL